MLNGITIHRLLEAMTGAGGSDLHLKEGRPPLVRIDGELAPFDLPILSGDDIAELINPVLTEKSRRLFAENNEADFSMAIPDMARFRVNVFRQRGHPGAVMRRIPLEVPTAASLGLPKIIDKLADNENGLVLVTGPTGSGKSTTLAAMIQRINTSRRVHVMTIEDPIEFVYEDNMAVINQRELGLDTYRLDTALRAVLRQDPDIILMGEMRDADTIRFGVTAAETGHLVFATLHTNSAPQTLERLLDTMPAEARDAMRGQLSLLLRGIVCQRLARRAGGKGRVAVLEILFVNETIRQLIAENRLKSIHGAMSEGAFYGMQTFNQALDALVKEKAITEETALDTSDNPEELRLLFKGIVRGSGTSQRHHPDPRADGKKPTAVEQKRW